MSPSRPNPVHKVLAAAGYDPENVDPPTLVAADELITKGNTQPEHVVVTALRSRREAELARAAIGEAQLAVSRMEAMLTSLLEGDALMGRLEMLHVNGSPRPTALCRLGPQIHELPIHPDVDIEALGELKPWDYVCVHAKEMVVTGTIREDHLYHRAQGEVVEFKGWHDRDHGLVRVSRQGHEETVVSLAPELRDEPLDAPARLVLQRDDDRYAIARVSSEEQESPFEYPVAGIETRLDDLAGLDPVVEPLVQDILLRLVRPDLRTRFGLRPLRGLLLYSYKPGMGKTALIRAVTLWLSELGEQMEFDVVLYLVKPNELKSMWHGGDAKLVREELCGAIQARQRRTRTRPLFQFVVLDEVDSLGSRAGGHDAYGPTSSAHNDAVQALLSEMDGMLQQIDEPGVPPAHVVFCGLTNRPDLVDAALKRPGRFGDLVLEVPSATIETGEAILAVYARELTLPWWIDGNIVEGLPDEDLKTRILRPVLAGLFDTTVLRYATDARQGNEVTAGQVMASVHYMEAMNTAKKRAAMRALRKVGVPAVSFEDVAEGLLEQAVSAAAQMEGDRNMLRRQLRIKVPVTRVDLVPQQELADHGFVTSEAS